MRIRLNHFLVLVQLCLLGAGAVCAQPGWMPPPTPCDTVRPFNLGWRTDTVITDGLRAALAAKADSAVGMLPGLDSLWRTALRAMVLDPQADRCPDYGALNVDLPAVTHATLDISTRGFSLQAQTHHDGRLTYLAFLFMVWNEAATTALWGEEVLDDTPPSIIRRQSDNGTGIATLVLVRALDGGRILAIERYRDDLRVGLQYMRGKDKDQFRYVDPRTRIARTLHLDLPEDQAIWQREGKAFYNEAFNFYFRLPEPLLEFAPPAEKQMRYRNPFSD